MGIATSRISVDVVRTSDYYTKVIRDYEDLVKKNITKIVDIAAMQGIKLGKHLCFRLGIENENIYAFEVNKRAFIKLGPLR
ncbi:hypothetical protein BpOF4_06030 [Alkalihalophilus pseudofirmus OF4]|uniref:Uncharacterized protein n=1 Tax=Alkalihalophilus pseudofirmus (strain ATCC BAA-2126 / JCM 17055 / OF4) TaxID=398511 RepID=D3FZM6_ALKPO|nr:hypothetical protein [Alkalihalophilus pseudofirmus]ADC49268.1 hypothetical protein BpOF4_06030 [Alkalihalophilus pseudofirmus OF4]